MFKEKVKQWLKTENFNIAITLWALRVACVTRDCFFDLTINFEH